MKQEIRVALTTCLTSLVFSSYAEQGGTGHYISGQTASFMDALPCKPGWVYENIFLNYNNASFGASRGLPFGRNIALNVTASINADTSLGMYTPTLRVLGGFPSFAVLIPYLGAKVDAAGTITTPGGPRSRSRSDYASGLGDIELYPFMLGWTNGDIKYDTRCAIYAPTGEYDSKKLANVGLGYWTFEPEITFSWLSTRIGTEVSIFTGADFNTKNTDADYQSGDIFHIDSTVAQHLPLLGGIAGAGANAFYYKQFTGDSGSGAKLGGFEAESYGVGPVGSYVRKFGKTNLAIEAKWLPQLHAANTTKGNYVWVKTALLF